MKLKQTDLDKRKAELVEKCQELKDSRNRKKEVLAPMNKEIKYLEDQISQILEEIQTGIVADEQIKLPVEE